MKQFFLFFIFSIFIFSCENLETVVDLDVPESPPVLTLNGVLDTDTTIRVLISHSVGAFSNQIPESVNDAEALLFENSLLIDTLNVNLSNTMYFYFTNSGLYDSIPMHYYESTIIPSKNKTYEIKVDHIDYPEISASTYIPDDINLYDIEVDTVSNEDVIGFNFSFLDSDSQDNYYRLKLFSSCSKKFENENGEMEIYYYTGGFQEFQSNDPSFPSSGIPWEGYTFSGRQVVFSDALFHGEEKNIRLDIETDGYRYEDCDTIRLQFSVFSSDTYSYYNSLNDHRNEGGASIFGGEIVPVYSNVENGLGAIISTNAQIIQIKP